MGRGGSGRLHHGSAVFARLAARVAPGSQGAGRAPPIRRVGEREYRRSRRELPAAAGSAAAGRGLPAPRLRAGGRRGGWVGGWMGRGGGCPGAALLPRSVGVARRGPPQVPPAAAPRIPRPAQAGAAPAAWGLVHPGVSHVWVGMLMRTFPQPLCALDLFSDQDFNGCSPLCAMAYPQGRFTPTVFSQ